MIRDVDGMRLKIDGNKAIVGPLTKQGSIVLSGNLYPYPPEWGFYRDRLQELFGEKIEGEYKLGRVSLLTDQTIIFIEFDKVL